MSTITYNLNIILSGTNSDPIVSISVNGNTVIQTLTSQCFQIDYLILQFTPFSNPNTNSACALVNWTSIASLNPSTTLSMLNLNLSNPRENLTVSFDSYQGPTIVFLLNIGLSCSNSSPNSCVLSSIQKECSTNSQSSSTCSSFLNSLDLCLTENLYFQNVTVNINMNASQSPNNYIGGAIGLFGIPPNTMGSITGSISYSLTYTNFYGYTTGTSVLYNPSGYQYWTFPESIPSTYKSSSKFYNALSNIYEPSLNEQGLNLCLYNEGNYGLNNNFITTKIETLLNPSQDCLSYTENNTLYLYQFMPCGTEISSNAIAVTGGLSNATILCASTNQNQNECNEICLANCSLF